MPPVALRHIFDQVVAYGLHDCLELGTGFGTTACVIASALDCIGGGRLVTIDLDQSGPVNVGRLMAHCGIDPARVEIVAEPLGYNWWLGDALGTRHGDAARERGFDFCLLDGAHEWNQDALAFLLVARLLRPGGWLAVDDLDFRLRQVAERPEFGARDPRELDSFQMRQVWDLLVQSHPDFGDRHEFPPGRLGWARKLRPRHTPLGWPARLRRAQPRRLGAPGF